MEKKTSIDRRRFLQTIGMSGFSLALPRFMPAAGSEGISNQYDGLNSGDYLGQVMVETRISDTKVFSEGPAVDRAGHVYFTNIPADKIMKWNRVDKRLSVFRAESNAANGLRFLMNGDLLACEGGSGSVTKTSKKTGSVTVIAERFNGKRLQSPNDIDFDSRGRIYFSSRTNEPDPDRENLRSVYRIDPDGEIEQLLSEPRIHMPNGIVVSPDEKTLYVIEAHPDEDRHRNILAFDLLRDGSIANERTLIDFYPGRSGDGMCIDAKGNLYVAAGLHKTRGTSETLDTRPGIHVMSPQGKLLAYRETPEDTITNCTFGGEDLRTLYVTCGSYLLSIRTSIPGKGSYKPDV